MNLNFPIRGDKLRMEVKIEETLCKVQSEFQSIEIIRTAALGKMLMLDGHVQLSSLDEWAYHECLVQIPLLSMKSPSRALVIGGGDGGVLRELCRWPSMERIEMVEIDGLVVDSCRNHLPELSAGAFDDPRVHLHIADAFPYVQSADGNYDLIVVDATDVYEEDDESLSEQLFTEPFYARLRELLSPQGMVVTQADNLLFCPYSLEGILDSFRPVFPKIGSYWGLVPSFGGYSGFAWGSLGHEVQFDWPSHLQIQTHYLNPTTLKLAGESLPFTDLS